MGRPECRLVRFLFFVLVGCLVSCFDKTSLAAAAAAAEQDFPSKPWISDDELVFLRTFLGPGKVMLEFGSGGSTRNRRGQLCRMGKEHKVATA